jgi:hypothetical protein
MTIAHRAKFGLVAVTAMSLTQAVIGGSECEDALYSNGGYDGAGGLGSFYGPNWGYAYVADGAAFSEAVLVDGFIWWAVEFDAGGWNGYALVSVYLPDGAGGEPGTASYFDYRAASRSDTGIDLYDGDVYIYRIEGLSVPLDA